MKIVEIGVNVLFGNPVAAHVVQELILFVLLEDGGDIVEAGSHAAKLVVRAIAQIRPISIEAIKR